VAHVSATRSYQPVRGVVAGIQLNHTHWVLVAPRVPEKAYRALWLFVLSKLLCQTYSLRPLPTGLGQWSYFWLINGLIMVNLTVKWSIVVPTINNCFFLGLGDFSLLYLSGLSILYGLEKLILNWALCHLP